MGKRRDRCLGEKKRVMKTYHLAGRIVSLDQRREEWTHIYKHEIIINIVSLRVWILVGEGGQQMLGFVETAAGFEMICLRFFTGRLDARKSLLGRFASWFGFHGAG